MPALLDANEITPKSVLRHRPINATEKGKKTRAKTTQQWQPPVTIPRASRTRHMQPLSAPEEIQPAVQERKTEKPKVSQVSKGPGRPAVSECPEIPAIQKLQKGQQNQRKAAASVQRARPASWVLLVVSGMLLATGLVLGGQLIGTWWNNTWNTLHYGYPRTYQTDAFVGDETGRTPSHFIALNLHDQIEILELPGGDAAHIRIYQGPRLYGPGADLVPVTLRFVLSTNPKYPDMLVEFQGTHVLFRNLHGTFQMVAA